MRHLRPLLRHSFVALVFALVVAPLAAQNPPAQGGGQTPPAQGGGNGPQGAAANRGPRPYDQVITAAAKSERGVIAVHKVGERYFFEIDNAMLGRDFLLVSRISGVPAGQNGFNTAGSSLAERMVRWEKRDNTLLLKSISVDSYADPETPIAKSVAENNFAPILASFPIAAFGSNNATSVVDVTDFFAGDTPALTGLSTAQRRSYGVQRFDTARSFVSDIRSFPTNVEVRHVQTFAATEGPGDRSGGTISLEMRQSIVLLPKEPMKPRAFDPRVGYFTVERVNYGLDQQKAATETFITRWRLEPKDPAAYARGELVEPVKPIVYYIDPATPLKWRKYVKEGVEQWQKVFEKAGFKNAILAKDPPTKAEDPDWDPDDARVSMIRWAASLVRNAVGPHTSDPRTGEILNSEITWFHNHMRSYRNWLLMETGAANPEAQTIDIPEELMGETMRQVIAHETGHALGLQHNMVASSSFPVESLRDPKFTSQYGVSATIMDYARQNYVAQPGDGLQPKDFIRRVGPFDDFAINWGYRVIAAAPAGTDGEKKTLDSWITNQTGRFPYRFVPAEYGGVDPRSQTEDLGDDPVKASAYAVMNYKRMIPSLIKWTTRPGADYTDLQEVYTEALGRWAGYMGHVANQIAGVNVDLKTADQAGAVFTVVPKAKQQAALAFLNDNVFVTPEWLQPASISALIGPSPLPARQVAVLNNLLSNARLGRLETIEKYDAANAYPLAEYFGDVKRLIWNSPQGARPDANRRALQRAYIARLGAIVNPPPPAAGPAGGAAGPATPPGPFLAPVNLAQSDLPALARAQLRAIQAQAKAAQAAAATPVIRAHWGDVADRVAAVLDPKR